MGEPMRSASGLDNVSEIVTTERTIEETVRLIDSTETGVIRLRYFPVVHRDSGVTEALFKAIEKSIILEILYYTGAIRGSDLGRYVSDTYTGEVLPFTEMEGELFAHPNVKAVCYEGGKPNICDSPVESFLIHEGRIKINPQFLMIEPKATKAMIYAYPLIGTERIITASLYRGDFAALFGNCYADELTQFIVKSGVPHPQIS